MPSPYLDEKRRVAEMKRWVNIFLALVILALISSGCAGGMKSGAGFDSYENPGFTTNSGPHSLEYYQMFGY
jgi:hypothetical protein